ncbi:mannose-1-phosphate guanylyltransferase [Bacteroidia bacterium]|nr:mannose-1-phosphate guanylyltransferase [Bacteroidia bacterium]
MNDNHLVIMAGGIGSRFWPLSTPTVPKQFIDIMGVGKTLIQLTADRFADFIPAENVWIVTSKGYKDLVRKQLPEVPESNILLEPCMRNTAPCIAYVSWKIKKKHPNANIVVSPADHIVLKADEFKRVISKGLEFTASSANILTLGIQPSRPETGYGYIKRMSEVVVPEIFKVDSFKEKPDLAKAQTYVEEGVYLWNAGIFLWNVNTIEAAFRQCEPQMSAIFDKLANDFYTEKEQDSIDTHFPTCKAISIDYAIMEHAENIYVFPSDLGWSDVGTWGSLYELSTKDEDQNVVLSDNCRVIECKNCMTHVSDKTKIVVQGLDNCIIAENNGVFLICKKDQEQRIKEFSQLS